MQTIEHEVIVVGSTGPMLAAELSLAGMDVALDVGDFTTRHN